MNRTFPELLHGPTTAYPLKHSARSLLLCCVVSLTCTGALAQDTPPVIPQDEDTRGQLEAEPGLQGVPERVQARIFDTTTVAAQKQAFEPTAVPGLRPYVSLVMKERPWYFTPLRPRHRRLLSEPEPVALPNAIADVFGESPGRVSYDVTLTDSSDVVHGALWLVGDHRNDAYTQERGSYRSFDLGGIMGWANTLNDVNGEASWRGRSSGWIKDAASTSFAATETSLVRGALSGEHVPSESGGTRFVWRAEAASYEMLVVGLPVADRLTEGAVHATLESGWDVSPVRLNVHALARRTQAVFPTVANGAQDTGIAALSLENRSFDALNGVVDADVGVAGYTDPFPRTGERTIAVRVPFRLGWTTVLGALGNLRLHGGYSAQAFPIQEYTQRDFVVVDEGLPILTHWNAGASFWRRQWGAVVGSTVEWVNAANLPVWAELTQGSNLIAWRPRPVAAQLVRWSAFVEGVSVGPVGVEALVRGEASEPASDEPVAHLPYRPSVSAVVRGTAALGAGFGVSAAAVWTGPRYVDLVSNEQLEGYVRLRAEVAKRVTGATVAFAMAETSVGEARDFKSEWTGDAYDLAQHTVGFGLRSRL